MANHARVLALSLIWLCVVVAQLSTTSSPRTVSTSVASVQRSTSSTILPKDGTTLITITTSLHMTPSSTTSNITTTAFSTQSSSPIVSQPSSSTAPSGSNGISDLPVGPIVGGAVAGGAILSMIGIWCFCLRKRREKAFKASRLADNVSEKRSTSTESDDTNCGRTERYTDDASCNHDAAANGTGNAGPRRQ